MAEDTMVLTFENVSVAEANRYAEDLRRDLLDADPSVQVQRRRYDPNSLDFGASLVLVLGAPAVVVLAKAVEKWLIRNNAASIRLEGPDGILIAKNLDSKNAAAVLEAFRRGH